MARKNQKKTPPFRNTVVVTYFFIAVFVLFTLFFVSRQVKDFFCTAALFRIQEVVIPSDLQFIDAQSLNRLVGQNIFRADLVSLQHRLRAQYPEIDQLKVSRRFPDRIVLSAKKREAFACLAAGKQDVVLDKEGYVISVNRAAGSRLPIIRGVPAEQSFTFGRPLSDSSLQAALRILDAFQQNESLRNQELSHIDVSNISKINLFFSNNLNVVLDQDKVTEKFAQLALLFAQESLDFAKIDYIDLRFKEPVIRWKE